MSDEPKPDETAWLIEKWHTNSLYYFDAKCAHKLGLEPLDGWTRDANEAVRFARREDAEQVQAWLLAGEGRVVEHRWMA